MLSGKWVRIEIPCSTSFIYSNFRGNPSKICRNISLTIFKDQDSAYDTKWFGRIGPNVSHFCFYCPAMLHENSAELAGREPQWKRTSLWLINLANQRSCAPLHQMVYCQNTHSTWLLFLATCSWEILSSFRPRLCISSSHQSVKMV